MADFGNLRQVKRTRKPHNCAYCGAEIPVGSAAEVEFGVYEGDPYSRYRCEACSPYVDAFWNDMDGECGDVGNDFWLWVEENEVSHPTLTVEVPCRSCGKPVRMMKWVYEEEGFAECPECEGEAACPVREAFEPKRLLDLACHCIGLDKKKPESWHGRELYEPYRNYFETAEGCTDFPAWEELASRGYAEGYRRNGFVVYSLTRAGLDWVGGELGVTVLDESD